MLLLIKRTYINVIRNQTTAQNVRQFRPTTNSTVGPLDGQEIPHVLRKINLLTRPCSAAYPQPVEFCLHTQQF